MGHMKPMFGFQEINGWGPGKKWFVPRKLTVGVDGSKSMAAVQVINGWGTGNQWLGARKHMVGAQESNSSGTGGQCMGPRK